MYIMHNIQSCIMLYNTFLQKYLHKCASFKNKKHFYNKLLIFNFRKSRKEILNFDSYSNKYARY